ncbi:MAG: YidC/Oxa1 family membrane protein insertase [Acidimicrobiia bacterium]|nr:MAG: YidC/Oxa1 family membrane protein insertase [Acidimicrobiia bacterium]
MNPWTLLLNALGTSLAFFYDIIPEYGISIIFLTVAVSLLLFPLTVKQTRSMKGMSEIQPEVKRLQKEYKEDREELNKRLMELYKEKGVNPAAGCLPLVVQMPIWFALYRVLWQGQGVPADSALGEVFVKTTAALEAGVAITAPVFDSVTLFGMNLRVSPAAAVDFNNIVASLPYIILLVIIVAAGFYQQVQTTRKKSTDGNDQQSTQMQGMQNAMKIMPVIFGFISWNLVSGLGVYFATSNTFRIGQQALILRMGGNDDDGKKVADGLDRPPDNSSDGPKTTGPSQHASKKRNRRKRK